MSCRQWGATESSGGRGRNIAEQAERKLQAQGWGRETTGEAGAELCTQRRLSGGAEGRELVGHFSGGHISTSWTIGPHL